MMSANSMQHAPMERPMTTFLNRLFLTHPRAVDESYLEHFRFALSFSGQLALGRGGGALPRGAAIHLRAHRVDNRCAALRPDP